jgi:hypothetical protein
MMLAGIALVLLGADTSPHQAVPAKDTECAIHSISSGVSQVNQPRFCQDCGRSLIPLRVPHVSRPCDECGKSAYFANPDSDGTGIQVQQGDTFTIPEGWLTLSLDPSRSRGTFTRSGIDWFVESMIFGEMPSEPAKVVDFLTDLSKKADDALSNSTRMPGLDVDSESDMKRAFQVFSQETDTVEWRAIMIEVFSQRSLKLLHDGSSKEELAQAVAKTVAAYAMLVYKQSLESHVWAGYEQTLLVYNIAAAVASTPAEAKAIKELRPAFANLSEDVLAAWVGADVNIAEKLGIKGIDEKVIKALARYHLSRHERQRQEEASSREAKSRVWGNRIAAAAVGATLVGILIPILIACGIISTSSSHSSPTPTVSSSHSGHAHSPTPSR